VSSLKKLMILSVATIAVVGAVNGGAEARAGLGWAGFGGATPLPNYLGRPYYGSFYGYPYYGYYGGGFEGCFMRSRTVAYTGYGHAIKKRVRVCY
jgi:hypothetical protein